MATTFPPLPDSSEIVIEVAGGDYMASSIARAVEDCDAHLLNLNMLSTRLPDSDSPLVALRVDHRNADAVARSLERYGLNVIAVANAAAAGEDGYTSPYEDLAQQRAREVLRLLNV